ncbi:MAG: SDR family oxidoreductase [Acidobacteria bacterium]|nr:SDR family oxidoreductase [Acidobacteriota bacterium]
MYENIAIIGMSCRFPQAENFEEFWLNISSGVDLVRDFPQSRVKELADATGSSVTNDFARGGYLETISYFEPEYFNISQEECKYIDPQQRLILELVEEAIQSSGRNPLKLPAERTGVFMSTSPNVYSMTIAGDLPMRVGNASEAAIAGRVSYNFNFQGPSIAINTESSSAMVALHYACRSLQDGECDYAITGGSRIHINPNNKNFILENMLTSNNEKIRAFDSKADGIVAGEGGGILLLKRLKDAVRDKDIIHAIIKGSSVNCNGNRSLGLSVPHRDAQADLITRTLEISGIDPATISYIEAHGTGTRIGDPIEIEGITKSFSKYTDKTQFIPIGSVKTNAGHLGGASAVPGIIKTIMALKYKKIPPSLHFTEPNPEIDFEHSPVYVNTRLCDWHAVNTRIAGINSLGLTGTNSYVLLEEPPAVLYKKNREVRNIFTLSARTETSLRRMMQRLNHYLKTNTDISANDAAFTLNTGRRHLQHRLVIIAGSKKELIEKLTALEDGQNRQPGIDNVYSNCLENQSIPKHFNPMPVFIYPDIEIENDFPLDNFLDEPVFANHFQQCRENLGKGFASRHFAFQNALSRLLISYGIEPKAVLGIGAGKIAADLIKEKITLTEAISLANNASSKSEVIDVQRLQTVIQQMLTRGYNLFLIIGGQRILGNHIEEFLQSNSNSHYLNLGINQDNLYPALGKLYTWGSNIDWEEFYKDRDVQKITLPTYPFDRKSYFLKTGILKSRVEPVQPVQSAEPAGHSENEFHDVQFDEIFAIFQRVIPGTLDLDEDYVDNNGSSISIMQLITIIRETYHVTVNIDYFYAAPSLRQLIESIITLIREGGENVGAASPQIQIPELFKLEPTVISMAKVDPENILLTGSTGFLGSHLLLELVEKTRATIYCIVRGHNPADSLAHGLEMWNYYFKNRLEPYLGNRIIIIKGDIAERNIGVQDDIYRELTEKIETVIHCAADVRHYGKYEHFKKVNTGGTQNIIDFCCDGIRKKLHHVSTKAIFEYPRQEVAIKENYLDIGQVFRGRVYARSKFEAEKLVNLARSNGLEDAIYRIGDLTGRFSDGFFQKNIETNRYYNNIKALVLLKKIFTDAINKMKLEVSPVDFCCHALLNLVLLKDSLGNNFHIMNPNHVPLKKFCAALHNLGSPIEEVDYDTFAQYVDEEIRKKGFVKELSWISYLLTLDEYSTLPVMNYDSEFTLQVLKKTNFTWPVMEVDYLERMIKHCIDVKYVTF